jgi:hypothetical protein
MKASIMEAETHTSVKQMLTKSIEKNVSPENYSWLRDKAAQSADKNSGYQLNVTFTAIPRKTGKKEVALEESEIKSLESLLPGFTIQNWTIDRVARVWLLMQLEGLDKETYLSRIENLFPQAEMNELVALYSSLPVLAYPEAWTWRCAEGIRSNIGTVLEAIMYFNPYPARYLDEGAWNQLVMKAFFTDKNVNNIIGLDERGNPNLANTVFDYVEERWAAGREVNPQIWRLTGKYMDEPHFYMMEKLFKQANEAEMQAAALTCADSSFQKCKFLLDNYAQLKTAIERHQLSWETIAGKQ